MNKKNYLTIEEAQKRLSELENEEDWTEFWKSFSELHDLEVELIREKVELFLREKTDRILEERGLESTKYSIDWEPIFDSESKKKFACDEL